MRSRLLLTARQRGRLRCPRHGSRHLRWKHSEGGLELLTCPCGRVVAERMRCERCDALKEADVECRVCAAGLEAASAVAAPFGGLPRAIETDVELACAGLGGLCCRHADPAAVEHET